jgi:cobalt-zinc-cadmium efflux system outer membrane protein
MAGVEDLDAVINRRPAVLAAQARVQAAQAALRLAQSQRTRDVSVGAQYTHSPASPQNGFFDSNTYGVSVQVPLFINNYFEGDIRNAATGVDSAQTSLLKVKQEANAELHRAWSDMQSAQDQLARYRDELSVSARRAVDAAEYAFRNGAISVTDVLDARRTFRAISLDELNARADYAKALAVWRAATLETGKQ